jgi:outer membrane protein assembly factor BamB
VGNAAVTQEQRGEQEAVTRYDLKTGEPVWVTETTDVRFESPIAGIGPRATPTIHGGNVYTLGTRGMLSCLDLGDGRILWQRDTLAEANATPPEWQVSSSPLIVDQTVVVSPGGSNGKSLMAYDLTTGTPAWASGDDPASYASPLLANLAGTRQIVVRNQNSITGHDPTSGTVLWREPWPGNHPNVAQPLALGGDRLLVSSGYGIGSKVFRITSDEEGSFAVEKLWESLRLKAKFTNVVLHKGRVYGLDDGVMVCLDPETGERCWKRGRYGHGQLILVGDLLLLIAEDGDLLLIEANPKELREVAKIPQALDGKSWNNPALSGPYLLLRNAKTAVCYELPLEN